MANEMNDTLLVLNRGWRICLGEFRAIEKSKASIAKSRRQVVLAMIFTLVVLFAGAFWGFALATGDSGDSIGVAFSVLIAIVILILITAKEWKERFSLSSRNEVANWTRQKDAYINLEWFAARVHLQMFGEDRRLIEFRIEHEGLESNGQVCIMCVMAEREFMIFAELESGNLSTFHLKLLASDRIFAGWLELKEHLRSTIADDAANIGINVSK